jgi:hypothetical protein
MVLRQPKQWREFHLCGELPTLSLGRYYVKGTRAAAKTAAPETGVHRTATALRTVCMARPRGKPAASLIPNGSDLRTCNQPEHK